MSTLTVDGLHWGTAHIRHHISPHDLDFGLYPLPFKAYGRAHTLPLDRPGAAEKPPLEALKPFLSHLLYLTYGVTSVRQAGGMSFLSRTVPSAGGLYPCHLYLGVLPDQGEETGVYYYDPPGHRLTQIRTGKAESVDIWEDPPRSPLVFMVTACLYNSAWKYRDRALRYVLLDAGHLVENLAMTLEDLKPSVSLDFDDDGLAGLLDLDLSWEVPLALMTVNWNKSVSSLVQALGECSSPCFPEVRIRPDEIRYMGGYPLPARAHAEGRAQSGILMAASRVWSGAPLETQAFPRPLPGAETTAGKGVKACIPELMVRRRSSRNFVQGPVSRADLAFFMEWILGAGAVKEMTSITLAMSCQNCEGMDDGLYALDPEAGQLACMHKGAMNPSLAHVCLDQAWIGNATLVFLCLANLTALDHTGGVRAYRYAMMAAGRVGQRVYLGAEALGWGCCGIGAIYDREAQALLGLNEDSALMYALAVGPVKKKRL